MEFKELRNVFRIHKISYNLLVKMKSSALLRNVLSYLSKYAQLEFHLNKGLEK